MEKDKSLVSLVLLDSHDVSSLTAHEDTHMHFVFLLRKNFFGFRATTYGKWKQTKKGRGREINAKQKGKYTQSFSVSENAKR